MLASNPYGPQIILKLSSLPRARTIVVSKNVAKKAVDRNRIKRVIKEAQRKIEFPERNYTLIVKKNIANLKTQQVEQILKELLKKS